MSSLHSYFSEEARDAVEDLQDVFGDRIDDDADGRICSLSPPSSLFFASHPLSLSLSLSLFLSFLLNPCRVCRNSIQFYACVRMRMVYGVWCMVYADPQAIRAKCDKIGRRMQSRTSAMFECFSVRPVEDEDDDDDDDEKDN